MLLFRSSQSGGDTTKHNSGLDVQVITMGGWVIISVVKHDNMLYLFTYLFIYFLPIYLFIWVLMPFSIHCVGHITTGSFIGRGNQYRVHTVCQGYVL